MRGCWLMLAVLVAGCGTAAAPDRAPDGQPAVARGLQTPAEASEYQATSRLDEVVAFVDQLAQISPMRVGSIGTSSEGRDMPLVVWGAEAATAEAVRQSGKTRVLVIGNIHGGEVAGKDAMLELLRDLAAGDHSEWADSLALLVVPVYNADGNEQIGADHRPLQDGPVEGMGQRPNAHGLDLNRDFTKLASPEARALVGLIRDADPHVIVDLHTTNGTRMGYHLTYAPGLSPSTPAAIDADLRERWLPAISEALLATDDFATYHYGNVPGAFGEEASAPRGWYSFSAQPRFSTNYAGLRGRYAILSEAYSYAPFDERVAVSRRFVEEILNRAWAEATRIRQQTEAADATSVVGEEIAMRSTWDALPEPVDILLGEVDSLRHPRSGALVLRRRDVRRPERMPAFVRFRATETATAPEAYVVRGAARAAVRDLLDAHGIRYATAAPGPTQRFQIDSVTVAERPFQNVRQRTAHGAWESADALDAAPALVVPIDQPLGRLAVVLLDPRSEDGLVAWDLLPEATVRVGGFMPIERIPAR